MLCSNRTANKLEQLEILLGLRSRDGINSRSKRAKQGEGVSFVSKEAWSNIIVTKDRYNRTPLLCLFLHGLREAYEPVTGDLLSLLSPKLNADDSNGEQVYDFWMSCNLGGNGYFHCVLLNASDIVALIERVGGLHINIKGQQKTVLHDMLNMVSKQEMSALQCIQARSNAHHKRKFAKEEWKQLTTVFNKYGVNL